MPSKLYTPRNFLSSNFRDAALPELFTAAFSKMQPIVSQLLYPPLSNILATPLFSTGLQSFADKIVEESLTDTEFVWIHDYHLLVLPSLLRKRFNRIRAGVFLHSPFPSSEIFRTFPKREELLRSLLNAHLIGVCSREGRRNC